MSVYGIKSASFHQVIMPFKSRSILSEECSLSEKNHWRAILNFFGKHCKYMILCAHTFNFIFNTVQVKWSVSFVCTQAEVDGNYDRHGLDSV